MLDLEQVTVSWNGNSKLGWVKLMRWGMLQGDDVQKEKSDFLIFSENIRARLDENKIPFLLQIYLNLSEYQKILEFIKSKVDELQHMELGSACCFQKKDYPRGLLPRSFTVLRTLSGEYQLIIETKSKIAGGYKLGTVTVLEGTAKKGKIAYRMDTASPKATLGFRSQLPIDSIEKKEECMHYVNAKNEVVTTQLLDPAQCTAVMWGGFFSRDSETFYKMYSEYTAFGDLRAFLNKSRKMAPLNEEQKNKLKLSLLECLAACHRNQLIHNDLTADNVLVYKINGEYCVKLADFGACVKVSEANKKFIVIACTFASPEIISGYLNQADWKNETQDIARKYNIAFYSYKKDRYKSYGCRNKVELTKEERNKYRHPDQANDMWACGIIFYFIEKGELPTFTTNVDNVSALTKKLLNPRRAERVTAEQALAIMQEQWNQEEPRSFEKVSMR